MGIATKTGQVVYSRKGDPGDRGATLRGPMAWDDMPAGFPFQSGAEGEQFIDIVVKDGAYYQCKVSHTKAEGNGPGSNYGYWGVASQLSFVATQLLLATYALVKNLGVESVEMKDAEGNTVFTAKDGDVTCRKGTFEGVDVRGDITASTMRLGICDNATGEAENGFIRFRYPGLLPEVQPGECRQMYWITPKVNRTLMGATLQGASADVSIWKNGDFDDSAASWGFNDIAGTAFLLIGVNGSDIFAGSGTVWSIFPLNAASESALENAT